MDILHFKSLGGSNSQIDIYVNETKSMQIVRDRPNRYRNHLLELVNERHEDSVRMLTFLFQSGFTSDQIWGHLENYFLGILPEELETRDSDVVDIEELAELPVRLVLGESLRAGDTSWREVGIFFSSDIIASFDRENVPMADSSSAKLVIGEEEIDAHLVWQRGKLLVSKGEESADLRELAKNCGWTCIPITAVSAQGLLACLGERN